MLRMFYASRHTAKPWYEVVPGASGRVKLRLLPSAGIRHRLQPLFEDL